MIDKYKELSVKKLNFDLKIHKVTPLKRNKKETNANIGISFNFVNALNAINSRKKLNIKE